MSIFKKIFLSMRNIKEEQKKIEENVQHISDITYETRKTLREIRATLNGEDAWFLKLHTHDSGSPNVEE